MTVADVVYERLTPIYDVLFGPLLRQGRERAIAAPRSAAPASEFSKSGVGTGNGLGGYPPSCRVTAVDLSMPMLERARRKAAQSAARSSQPGANGRHQSRVPDSSFDAV